MNYLLNFSYKSITVMIKYNIFETHCKIYRNVSIVECGEVNRSVMSFTMFYWIKFYGMISVYMGTETW